MAAETRAGQNKRRLTATLALTSTYLVVEVIGGLLTGSLALLADAGHMLTDVGGLALALVAIRFAERPATPLRTYGYHRVEILAALVNGVVLVGISAYILYEAYERFRHPVQVASLGMLGVASVGLLVNVAGIWILKGRSAESLNVRGAYLELLSDLISSVGVILAALILWTTGWYYADPLISAGIGLFILPRTWRLLRETVGVLLEGTPSDVNLAAIRQALEGLDGVVGVHDLHVWALTSGVNALSAHVVVRNGNPHDGVLADVHQMLKSTFGIGHVTVQLESEGWERSETHL